MVLQVESLTVISEGTPCKGSLKDLKGQNAALQEIFWEDPENMSQIATRRCHWRMLPFARNSRFHFHSRNLKGPGLDFSRPSDFGRKLMEQIGTRYHPEML